MNTTPLRIGVFGGAFDPPHRAHRILAETALVQFALDELLILPTGQAWHKSRPLTPAHHRWAMTELAFVGLPRVRLDPREILRQGPSYTFDTLTELQAERPGHHWFLFIGEDQARVFTAWHRWQDIMRMATLVVAERPLTPTESAGAEWHNLWQLGAHRLDMSALDISATGIRNALQDGTTPDDGPLPNVLDYIDQHQLYRPHHE